MRPDVIDCHCHAGSGDGLTGPWDTRASLDKYLPRAAAAGISRTVLLAAFHSDYAVANEEVARILASDRRRFLAFAFVHPERDKGRVARMVDRAARVHGFVGLKVHRHDARITREVVEVARAWRMPILYDVFGEISGLELVASEYPTVPFIVPHLGSFPDDWRAQRAFLDLLQRHPNVHTDTSGVRNFDLLVEAVQRGGARKVLFGSDGPWTHPGVEKAKVDLMALSPTDRQLVLGGNLLRLVNRVRPPSVPVRPHVSGELPADRNPWVPA